MVFVEFVWKVFLGRLYTTSNAVWSYQVLIYDADFWTLMFFKKTYFFFHNLYFYCLIRFYFHLDSLLFIGAWWYDLFFVFPSEPWMKRKLSSGRDCQIRVQNMVKWCSVSSKKLAKSILEDPLFALLLANRLLGKGTNIKGKEGSRWEEESRLRRVCPPLSCSHSHLLSK